MRSSCNDNVSVFSIPHSPSPFPIHHFLFLQLSIHIVLMNILLIMVSRRVIWLLTVSPVSNWLFCYSLPERSSCTSQLRTSLTQHRASAFRSSGILSTYTTGFIDALHELRTKAMFKYLSPLSFQIAHIDAHFVLLCFSVLGWSFLIET